jgi:hypothetical protein
MSLSPVVLPDRRTVQAVQDGEFALTVILPPDMIRDYCLLPRITLSVLLSSYRKSVIATAQLRAASRAIDHEAEFKLSEYRARLVTSGYFCRLAVDFSRLALTLPRWA